MVARSRVGPVLVLALGFAVGDSFADTVTLSPTKDAYVQSVNATTNFGNSEDMLLGYGGSFGLGYVRGLIQFDLSSLPTDPSLITSATLMLYEYTTEPAAGGHDIYVLDINEEWDEGDVTWNTQPTYNTGRVWAIMELVGGSHDTDTWKVADVLELVQNHVSGEVENLGWRLQQPFEGSGSSRVGYFHTREYTADTTLCPQLVVEYVPEPTSLALLGVAGLTLIRRRGA